MVVLLPLVITVVSELFIDSDSIELVDNISEEEQSEEKSESEQEEETNVSEFILSTYSLNVRSFEIKELNSRNHFNYYDFKSGVTTPPPEQV